MKKFNIWIDDLRPIPVDYDLHIKSVWEFIFSWDMNLCSAKNRGADVVVVDLDHDAGDYEDMGGNYIEILRFFERMCNPNNIRNKVIFKIHTMNPPAKQLMLNIIERNNWVYED